MFKKFYFLIPIVIAIAIALGFTLGFTIKLRNAAVANMQTPLGNLMQEMTPSSIKYSTIFSLIKRNYVDEVAVDSIAESMIPSLLGKLDPHSSYIPKIDVSLSTANLEGKFDGIGVVFNMITDTIIIQSVVPGGPSSKVGIQSGDRIITIDDNVVAGRRVPQDSILRSLRGVGGTKVKLGIERSDIDSLVNITVTRGKVVINSIDASYMIKPTVGYIKLLRFSRSSHTEMVSALEKLKKEGMKHLILDLTDNRGGYLDQAILIANEFLPKGNIIVSTQGRDGVILNETAADGRGKFIGQDVLVLVNENSASSSEIVAGALQDNDAGLLIGRRTFGKGLVQQQIPLFDGSLLNLTIARYHTPTGRCIQRPYMGSSEEYDMDYYNRAIHGELTNRDSVRLDTTLRYTTPKGKVVYGGGGIMPDIFVPIDTLKYTHTERKLLISLVLLQYTNKYIDQNRQELLKVDSFAALERYFEKNSDNLYNGYIKYVNDKGAKVSKSEAAAARKVVENLMKAHIGQFTKEGDNALYRYLAKEDDIIIEALKNCVD